MSKTETKKLYEIPRHSPLRVTDSDGNIREATFHHIDGSYSYCTMDDEVLVPGKAREQIFHIQAWAPVAMVQGRWELQNEDGD